MTRFAFILAIALSALMPAPLCAQTAAPQTPAPQSATPQAAQPADDEVGNVASVQGNATATRNGESRRLKVQDPIFRGDQLRTAAGAALGITFDDETTFTLSASASITVDKFIYEDGGKSNSALFKIALGTVAFAAHQVAKTGDMKIETPTSVLGIRGTSGVVEVPEGATPGTTGEVAVKLYADQDGRVGRIELFGSTGGPRLGLLTRAATGFSLRPGAGGRFAAVALTISPQQIARDRGFVQRTFAARNTARPMLDQRRNLRSPGQQRQPNQPGLRQPNRNQQNLNRPNLNRPNQNRPGQNQPGLGQPSGPRQGSLPGRSNPSGLRQPGQPQQGTAASNPGRTGAGNTPNLQRQNLQRPNLQRQPATTPSRQPARRKPQGNEPPR